MIKQLEMTSVLIKNKCTSTNHLNVHCVGNVIDILSHALHVHTDIHFKYKHTVYNGKHTVFTCTVY